MLKWLLVAWMAIYLWKYMARRKAEAKAKAAMDANAAPSFRKAAPGQIATRLVPCANCGVNLPEEEALLSDGHFYCCEAHRKAGSQGLGASAVERAGR